MSAFLPSDVTFQTNASQLVLTGITECVCSHACLARVTCQAAAYSAERGECRLSHHRMMPNNTETTTQAWTEGHKPGASPLTATSGRVRARDWCQCLDDFVLSQAGCLLDPQLGHFSGKFSGTLRAQPALASASAGSDTDCVASCQTQTPNCIAFRFVNKTCTLHAADAIQGSSLVFAQQTSSSTSTESNVTQKVFQFNRASGDPQQLMPDQQWVETSPGTWLTLLSDAIRNSSASYERCRQLDAVLYAPRSLDDLQGVLQQLDVLNSKLPRAELPTHGEGVVTQAWSGILLGIIKSATSDTDFLTTQNEPFAYDGAEWDITALPLGRRAFVKVGRQLHFQLTSERSLLGAICQYLGRDISRDRVWRAAVTDSHQVLSVDLGATYQIRTVRYTALSKPDAPVPVSVWVKTPAGDYALCARAAITSLTPPQVDTALACEPAVYGRTVRVVVTLPSGAADKEAVAQWPAVFGNQISRE
ncbi:hypothetical protein FJT64_014397 [Amphibalanus amphitrite]|uniref:Apple domain-containing protein n=1 Tax=Amphibalanus amphitrite TaxID=1232801 RepID=A0A6A4UTP1_AMPAM|nr:hypothetical protein FJT64_014397 [Amphibalanus amphitrite]